MKILVSVAVAMFLVGCSSETKDESTSQSVKSSASEIKKEVIETTKDIKDDVLDKAKEIKEEAKDIKDDVVEKAAEIKEGAVQKVQEVKQTLTQSNDGATLYHACAGCHGADGSRAALGKSQIIKGWDSKKIATALHGYKDGTYGGAMKGLMTGQVSKLSEEDIKILSDYISKF